jgi:hypothetical protein
MPTFPSIHSGRVTYKYPASRVARLRTQVHTFCDLNEQRYAKGVELAELELQYRRVTGEDKEILRSFYVERQGPTDTTWDLAQFDGVDYERCRFVGPLECTMNTTGLWDVRFRIKGFPVPAEEDV